MTVQMDHAPAAQMDHPPTPTADADWDLDITIVESGGVVDDLLRLTDDGCGTTCQSACTSCP